MRAARRGRGVGDGGIVSSPCGTLLGRRRRPRRTGNAEGSHGIAATVVAVVRDDGDAWVGETAIGCIVCRVLYTRHSKRIAPRRVEDLLLDLLLFFGRHPLFLVAADRRRGGSLLNSSHRRTTIDY